MSFYFIRWTADVEDAVPYKKVKFFAKGLLWEEAGAVGDWRSYTEEKSFSK